MRISSWCKVPCICLKQKKKLTSSLKSSRYKFHLNGKLNLFNLYIHQEIGPQHTDGCACDHFLPDSATKSPESFRPAAYLLRQTCESGHSLLLDPSRFIHTPVCLCVFIPGKSNSIVGASSLPLLLLLLLLPLLVSIRVLNRVPMGSRGWPTQPSRLVTDVTPLFSNSALKRQYFILAFKAIRAAGRNSYVRMDGYFVYAQQKLSLEENIFFPAVYKRKS